MNSHLFFNLMANNFRTRTHDGDCQLSTKYFLKMDVDDKKASSHKYREKNCSFVLLVWGVGPGRGNYYVSKAILSL